MYHTVRIVAKFNRKIVEICKIYSLGTHIHWYRHSSKYIHFEVPANVVVLKIKGPPGHCHCCCP